MMQKTLVWVVFAGGVFPLLAQANPGAVKALAPGERNLQVQAVAAPDVNNAQRVALVIGNAAYKDAPLTNPVNDARAIVKALQEAGFSVIQRENIDQRGMLSALREFGDHLRAGGTGLFYYAGHGMQIKGRNYLIPVGANIEREDEVAFSAVDAQAVLDKMEAAGNVANIMILDACRNNPFTRSTRSGQAGLAQMDAPVGTLVAYATSPGAVASDGTGANGLYTQHLLTAIRQPGNKVEDVFKQVRSNVRRDSQGKQVPWESTSLEGDFYFKGGPLVIVTVDPAAALEVALWDAVKGSSMPIEIRAYLNRYPTGKFAAEARGRLAQLQAVGAVPAVIKPLPQPVSAPAPATAIAPTKINRVPAPTQPNDATATLGHQEDDEAAVNRRTNELLANLATAPVVAAANPARARPVRPPAASNSAGFTVGDRWRYQTVDKFKQEVVNNWSRKVEAINGDGSLKLNGGAIELTGDGAIKIVRGANGYLREYSPAYKWIPSTLRVGYSEPVKLTLVWQNANGNNGTEQRDGTVEVLAKEMIKVPAGEFEAWKIEFSGFGDGKILNLGSDYGRRFKETSWYVPALQNYVAHENMTRDRKNKIVSFERHELTSFSVRGADSLMQR